MLTRLISLAHPLVDRASNLHGHVFGKLVKTSSGDIPVDVRMAQATLRLGKDFHADELVVSFNETNEPHCAIHRDFEDLLTRTR